MTALPEAQLIILRKVKTLAPDFHRHLVMSQARGTVVTKGDRLLVYEVMATIPDGSVMVTANSVFEFKR